MQLQLVEVAVAQACVVRFETGSAQFMHMPREFRAHEAEEWCRPATLVQSDAQASVAEHAIGVRPGVAGRELRESQSLVELD